MAEFLRAEPLPPRACPSAAQSAGVRWRRLWLPTPAMAALSVLLAALLLWFGWHFLQWAIVHAQWRGASSEACPDERGACWAFVIARWRPWLVGGYPADQTWRAWSAFALFVVFWAWVLRRPADAGAGRVLWGFLLLPVLMMLLLLGGGPLPFVPP